MEEEYGYLWMEIHMKDNMRMAENQAKDKWDGRMETFILANFLTIWDMEKVKWDGSMGLSL